MADYETLKRVSTKGTDYWLATEVIPALGYEIGQIPACVATAQERIRGMRGEEPENHIQRLGNDYALTRQACLCIAQDEEAKAYFAPVKRGRGRPRKNPPKRKLTPQELSLVRAAAGRKGGAAKAKGKTPTTSIRIPLSDLSSLQQIAQQQSRSVVDTIHWLICSYDNGKVSN